jgi:hypothetical protein
MAKNSFVIYHNYRDTLEDLTDEQVGILFRAIFDYEIDKKEPNFNGELKIAFRFIKKDLDLNSDKYESICERNRKNGQKGGAPKGNQNAKKQPKQPKQPDNDNEYDNEYDNILESKKESKNKETNNNNIHTHARETYDEIFENFCVEPMLKDTLIEFIRHCQLNKKMVTNDKLKNIIVHLDMKHPNDVYGKVQTVQNAISGGYFDIIKNKI